MPNVSETLPDEPTAAGYAHAPSQGEPPEGEFVSFPDLSLIHI